MNSTSTIRTSPPTARRDPHDGNTRLRLIAKVVRDVATSQRFASFADLKPALRLRLSRLGIAYQPREFDDAVSLVASNVELWRPDARRAARHVEQPDTSPELSRAEAAAFMAQLPGFVKAIR